MGKTPINGIRIRLARHGLRNQPYYHIVAIPAGKAREARPLEKLGEYDPLPRVRNTDYIPVPNRIFGKESIEAPKEKTVSWDLGRIKWWLGQGAEPTGTVLRLLEKAGVIEGTAWSSKASIKSLRKDFAAKSAPSIVEKLNARTKDTKQEYLQELENERWPIVPPELDTTTDTPVGTATDIPTDTPAQTASAS